MGKRLPTTPRSRVKNAIRQCWLRSRERAAAIKLHHNTCETCGKKGSVAKGREVKIVAHHREGINWDSIVDLIFERVLQTPEAYTILCKECHEAIHDGNKNAVPKDGV